MKFATILEALIRSYHIDKGHLAKHLETDEKTIDDWLQGNSVPSHHQLEHLSDMYIMPLDLLEKSVK